MVHVTLFGNRPIQREINILYMAGLHLGFCSRGGWGGKIAVSAYQGSKRYILYIYSKISRGANIQQGGRMPPHPPKKILHGMLSKDVASKCEADPVLYLLSCAL